MEQSVAVKFFFKVLFSTLFLYYNVKIVNFDQFDNLGKHVFLWLDYPGYPLDYNYRNAQIRLVVLLSNRGFFAREEI